MPANIAWWGWLLIAGVCWYVTMMMSVWTYKGGIWPWIIRVAFGLGMVLSLLIGVVRLVKWVWQG